MMTSSARLLLCYLLLLFFFFSDAEWIGTGRGIIVALPSENTSVLKEVPFYPYQKLGGDWYFWKSPSIPNGEFIKRGEPRGSLVWDAAGGSTVVGTPIILAPEKAGLDATKNQRWVFSENGRIYSIKEYPWKYVNVTPTGEIVLDNLNANSPYQIFKRSMSYAYSTAVRCYTPNLEVSIAVTTNGYGNYTLGTHKYFSFAVLNWFKISITATNGTVLRSYTSQGSSNTVNVYGTPTWPVGYHLWNFTRGPSWVYRDTFYFSANMSFANGKISGAYLINGTVPSTYPINGTYTTQGAYSFINGYIPFDPYEGEQYYGHIEMHPNRTVLTGGYYFRDKGNVDSEGTFEAVLFQ